MTKIILAQELLEQGMNQTDFKNGRVFGKLKSTGLRPRFMDKFRKSGVTLPDQLFEE